MRNYLFLIISSFSISLGAQIGAVVPDFTEYDIEGNEHHIYEYLDEGKFVVIDLFATWCSPCWSLHTTHALDSLYYEFGPEGTDQIVLLAIERSIDTGMDELMGIGPGTYGDWITGTPYPIIDVMTPTPVEIGASYPTISVICPYDRKIKDYLWAWPDPLPTMRADLLAAMDSCNVLANINEVEHEANQVVTIYPNPVSDITSIIFNASAEQSTATITLFNLLGEIIETKSVATYQGKNTFEMDSKNYESGTYIVQVQLGESILTSRLKVIR